MKINLANLNGAIATFACYFLQLLFLYPLINAFFLMFYFFVKAWYNNDSFKGMGAFIAMLGVSLLGANLGVFMLFHYLLINAVLLTFLCLLIEKKTMRALFVVSDSVILYISLIVEEFLIEQIIPCFICALITSSLLFLTKKSSKGILFVPQTT
jgi:hypothetical protein